MLGLWNHRESGKLLDILNPKPLIRDDVMTNEELINKLIEEANALAEKGNVLLQLSRKINPLFEKDAYINHDASDKKMVDQLYDRVLMYIEWRDEVTAKEITERFDLPTGYPSYEDKTMFAHIILNYLKDLKYLRCDETSKEHLWSITEQGEEKSKILRLVDNNPWWDELYF